MIASFTPVPMDEVEVEVCLLRTDSTLSVSPEYIMSIQNFPAQYILVENSPHHCKENSIRFFSSSKFAQVICFRATEDDPFSERDKIPPSPRQRGPEGTL